MTIDPVDDRTIVLAGPSESVRVDLDKVLTAQNLAGVSADHVVFDDDLVVKRGVSGRQESPARPTSRGKLFILTPAPGGFAANALSRR